MDNPAPPSVRIWVATLAQADLSLRRWLNRREMGRFRSYESQADQGRFLLGAAMLRSAVGQQLGVRPEDVPVDRTCESCGAWHGRPRVPGSSLQLSVSHAGLLVAFAMAIAGPVGIDVERVRSSRAAAESWTHQEARFKAGSGEDLLVHSLPLPWPGHLMAVAHQMSATVEVSISRQRLDLLRSTRSAVEYKGRVRVTLPSQAHRLRRCITWRGCIQR